MRPSDNPDYARQHRLVEFTSLQQTSPPGIHLTLSPTMPATTWNGVFFPRRGPYVGAILRFTLTFAPTPEIHLQTRVFHPLVDNTTGRVYLSGWDGEVVSELFEELKTSFESTEKLDSLAEGEVMDKEAWRSWNGRREGTGRWDERVAKFVAASVAAVSAGKGEDEAILLRAELGDVEKGVVDRVRGSVGEILSGRGVRVRDY